MFHVLALIVVGTAVGYRLAVAARIARAMDGGGRVRENLSAEELAFLAGGPRRVVTTLLFRMKREGRLSVSDDGTVTVHDDVYAPASIEAALVHAAGVSRTERLGKLVARASTSRAVQSIGDALEAEGLVIGPALRRSQRRSRSLLWWSAPLPGALSAVDVATGPSAFWWAGFALSAAAVLALRLLKPVAARVPYRVRWTLNTLRATCDRPSTTAVALDGLAASQEPELLALVTPETWKARQSPYGQGAGAAVSGTLAPWCGAAADWGSPGDGAAGAASSCGGGGGGSGCGSGCGGSG
ncbi:TIGR04222 domain-containing membrane protein [Streptomyces sp. NPDC093546]|uniref:TIGR04222 domain-containing membrane protein n=1 Tax=Streptomyces sp. NPDC093546 TaxID=3366040 RepID=UPI00382A09C9